MRSLAIAGVGLIGGSLGLALRRAGFDGRILGISSPATIELALRRGAIDAGCTLEEAAATADVIVLAQPIQVILATIDRLVPIARPDCLITDAGSTKEQIAARGRKLPLFLGGHPMAGKASSGVAEADAELFAGRPWIITPDPETGQVVMDSPLTGAFLEWTNKLGAVLVRLSPSEHDRTVAWTSHLPQLASTALASSLKGQVPDSQLVTASGPGLQDVTRLALSPWSVWKDIIQTNGENINHVLTVYIDRLTNLRDTLQTQRTEEEFSVAGGTAALIRKGLGGAKKEGNRP